jgi:hypothetical protein
LKNILPRCETDESVSKNVEKQTIRTKTTGTQPTKTNSMETSAINEQKKEVPVIETKTSQQRKAEKKGLETQTIEIDKSIGIFNLENEINKIKIIIPLVKLEKNPI